MLIFPQTAEHRFRPFKKEVISNHDRRTPIYGYVGLRGPTPTGETRVACDQAHSGRMGVVSHDRSALADPDGYGLWVVRNTYLKARTL